MRHDEKLTKVVVDIAHRQLANAEVLWARVLGDDFYEIRNVPFHAYGLNLLDVVRAVALGVDLRPRVKEVVRASGHRTLRAYLTDRLPEGQRPELLSELNALGAHVERAGWGILSIDIPPEGDYWAVFEQLAEWRDESVLFFETCEPRVPGRFDGAPSL